MCDFGLPCGKPECPFTQTNPCAEVPVRETLVERAWRTFPVVKTAAEAIEYLKRGAGVGIDCTGKTPEEAEEIMGLVREFQAMGLRRARSTNLFIIPEERDADPLPNM